MPLRRKEPSPATARIVSGKKRIIAMRVRVERTNKKMNMDLEISAALFEELLADSGGIPESKKVRQQAADYRAYGYAEIPNWHKSAIIASCYFV